MADKYRTNADLLDMINALQKRVSILERTPQLSNAAIDDGQLTVNGGVDNVGAKIILHSSDTADHSTQVVAYQDSVVHNELALFGIHRNSDDLNDGGKVLLGEDFALLAHQPATDVEVHIGLNFGGDLRDIYFQGKAATFYGNDATMFFIFNSIGAGFGGMTVGYGVTMASTTYPIVSIKTGVAPVAWMLTAYSNTGFTVTWNDTTAKDVMAFIVRV